MAGEQKSSSAKLQPAKSSGQLAIRDLKTIDDLTQLKAVEKEVWGMADNDTLPLTLAIACKAAGNIFVGAFDKDKKDRGAEKLVGFAFDEQQRFGSAQQGSWLGGLRRGIERLFDAREINLER